MTTETSLMRREILEIPEAVDRLLTHGAQDIARAAQAARDLDPGFAITVARGSSDHVCTYLKYATELLLGIPVASVGPSIASIYGAPLKLAGGLCLSVSQSGQSPDIVEMARTARRDGALSLAEWRGDDALRAAIHALPKQLEAATAIDWPEVRAAITGEQSLFTLGRGPVWAISNEAALKFKETCQIHAESYSSAEVLHGPVSIVDQGFVVLGFAAHDAAEQSLAGIADQISAKGARVFATSSLLRHATAIDHVRTDHPLTDPIALIVSFYAMVERIATARGINPDLPRHLNKVTQTL